LSFFWLPQNLQAWKIDTHSLLAAQKASSQEGERSRLHSRRQHTRSAGTKKAQTGGHRGHAEQHQKKGRPREAQKGEALLVCKARTYTKWLQIT